MTGDLINPLIAEYAAWNNAQGLNLGSADEHLHDETLTAEQRAWLADFSRRWEIAEERQREGLGWIIASTDADGNRQYWNNGYGWVEQRHDATAFTAEEMDQVALPIGGEWEEFEKPALWFIVVGRMWGDDEATALKLRATSSAEADDAYRTEMRSLSSCDGDEPEDGPGRVFVDQIFNCGAIEPKEG
jgi:hypothetical protein